MKNFNIEIEEINIFELEDKYKFVYDVFAEYTEIDKIKLIVSNLDITHRRIFLLYTELGSLQKVANIYRCAKTTINNKVKVVQNIIKEDINLEIEELLIKYKVC